MTKPPRIACICPTYGRLSDSFDHTIVINEAVESFHRQDYPNKCLYIVNDTPGQNIRYSHPDVVVLNVANRMSSIGAKRNLVVDLAKDCELFAVWDDDDISLPWRLSQIARDFASIPISVGYLSEGTTWTSTGNTKYTLLEHGSPGLTAAASYRREAITKTPYRDKSHGEDHDLYHDMYKNGHSANAFSRPVQHVSFIYRWGYLVRHVSGYGNGDGFARLGETQYPMAEIKLEPQWTLNYEDEVRRVILGGQYEKAPPAKWP